MNKFMLTVLGGAAAATLSSTAQAHDRCYRSDYGYRRPSVRVYYAPEPVYYSYSAGGYGSSYSHCRLTCYRSGYYRSSGGDCRPEYRHHRHHGVRGFFERIFR